MAILCDTGQKSNPSPCRGDLREAPLPFRMAASHSTDNKSGTHMNGKPVTFVVPQKSDVKEAKNRLRSLRSSIAVSQPSGSNRRWGPAGWGRASRAVFSTLHRGF